MLAYSFDTHAIIKRLQGSGFSESQAEALTSSWKEIQESQFENLATKSDIKDLNTKIETVKKDLSSEIETVKKDLNTKIETVKKDLSHEIHLLRWMVGVMLGGVIALVLKAFLPF